MIRLLTNILPPIDLSTDGASKDGVLSWVKPTLVDIPVIGDVAPYGEATPGLGGIVFLALLAVVVVGLVTILRALVRR